MRFATAIIKSWGAFALRLKMCIRDSIYAVGGNDTAAKFSGISTAKVKFVVYSFSGLMAGLAGITIASRLYSGTCTSGESAEMDAIAAVVVGGTSMSGGSGRLGGTLIGALIIGILDNGLKDVYKRQL